MLKHHLTTENSILNDTFHAFKAEHTTTDANIRELFRISNKNANDIEKIWIRQKFLFFLYELTYHLNDLLSFQDKIFNPRRHAIEICTADHLKELIHHIDSNTQQNESLPSYRSLHELILAASFSTHMTNTDIEFIIKLPLSNKCESKLYQKHLIPIANGPGTMSVIQDANAIMQLTA